MNHQFLGGTFILQKGVLHDVFCQLMKIYHFLRDFLGPNCLEIQHKGGSFLEIECYSLDIKGKNMKMMISNRNLLFPGVHFQVPAVYLR